MQIRIRDAILNSNRQLLIESITTKLGYRGSPMENVLGLYVRNLLEEIKTCDALDSEEYVAIYHIGLGQRLSPGVLFLSRDDVLESMLTIPPFEELISRLFISDGDVPADLPLSEKDLRTVFKYAPIMPVTKTLDYEKLFSSILGTTVFVEECGSVIGVALDILENIILAQGFLPMLSDEDWNTAFEEDEFFWLDDIEVETSIQEEAFKILKTYQILKTVSPLFD